MTTKLEIQMEIEKLDSEGYEAIEHFDVNIEATYAKDNGDHWNPPYEDMDINSVTLDSGEDYELSEEDRRRAVALLYEELANVGDSRYED